MNPYFANKVVIITGGASGIGKALAAELAKHGTRLVLADINHEMLQETVREISATGATVEGQAVDVRDAAQVRELVQSTHQRFRVIDFMFNNAGINVCGEFQDVSLEDWNFIIDVNLRGVVNGTHAVYPLMREQGHGHIINTASLAGLVPMVTETAYCATKHAVVGFSTALNYEARASGICVSALCPGVIDTPLIKTSRFHKVNGVEIAREAAKQSISAHEAAKRILKGVERKKPIIVVTGLAHVLWRLWRFAPLGVSFFSNYVLGRFRALRTE